MEVVFWLIGIGVVVLAASVWLVVRERRARRRPGDDDQSLHGDRSHSDAIAAAHTAGTAKRAF